MARIWIVFAMVVAACNGEMPDPGCRCVGDVPTGRLDVVCGGVQCVGGTGYRCTASNTAVQDMSACGPGPQDAGPGSFVCPDPLGCPGGCCAGSTCMPGTSTSACGAGGGACATCGAGETCSGGVCGGGGGCSVRGAAVGAEDTCTGETICDCGPTSAFCEGTGTCVPAFGRRYGIGIHRVRLPDRRPDGMCWDDPACGAPDPYVVLTIDGAAVGSTPAGSDVFNFEWSPPIVFEAAVLAGSSVRLDVFDEDLTSPDGAFACTAEPISAALLRSRSLGCEGALGGLDATIVAIR